MCEVMGEVTYVRHHKKRSPLSSPLCGISRPLCEQGISVDYVTLDDPENSGNFTGEVARAVTRHDASRLIVTAPGEFRVLEDMQNWETDLGIAVEIWQDDRFLCPRNVRKLGCRSQTAAHGFFHREMSAP